MTAKSKAKAEEAVENMRHPERQEQAKSQAESMLAFVNPLSGMVNKNTAPAALDSSTLNIDTLKQAVSTPAPEQNNKIESILSVRQIRSQYNNLQRRGCSMDSRQAASSYNRGAMFDKPAAAG